MKRGSDMFRIEKTRILAGNQKEIRRNMDEHCTDEVRKVVLNYGEMLRVRYSMLLRVYQMKWRQSKVRSLDRSSNVTVIEFYKHICVLEWILYVMFE